VDRSPGVIVLASDTPSHGPAPAAAVAWLRQELPGRVWLALGAVDPHAPADSFAWCTVAHRLAAGARLRREVVR
jgi:hypothetical protein